MKTDEFINREFQMLLEQEAAEHFDEPGAKQLLKWADNNLIKDLDELDDIGDSMDRAPENEKLLTLPMVSLVLKILRKFDDLENVEKDHRSVMEALEQRPDIKLLHLLKVITQLDMFKEKEVSFRERIDFLEDLLYNRDYLVKLDDFFSTFTHKGIFALSNDGGIEKYPEKIIALCEYAVKTYPEKLIFRFIMSTAYYYSKRYEDAIEQCSRVLNKANIAIKNDPSYKIDGYNHFFPQDIYQQMAFSYDKLGKDEQTIDLLNKVLKELPVISGPGEDAEESEMIEDYLDSFLIRMRINIRSGKMEAVFSDWSRIKDHFSDISYYEGQYPDVFKVVYDDELQKKFLKEGPGEANS